MVRQPGGNAIIPLFLFAPPLNSARHFKQGPVQQAKGGAWLCSPYDSTVLGHGALRPHFVRHINRQLTEGGQYGTQLDGQPDGRMGGHKQGEVGEG